MQYTDLIFDLYGTLVDIHTDQEQNDVWEKTAIFLGFHGAGYAALELKEDFERLTNYHKHEDSAAFQTYECFPEIQIEQVFEELLCQKGISENCAQLAVSAAQLFRLLSMKYLRLYPGVKDALTLLRQKGFKLWLLSNAQRVFTAGELRHLGLEKFFDGICLSSDYGCKKPDRRFFHALLDEQNIDKNHALMIGNDLSADMDGAKNVGIAGFYIHTNLSPASDADTLKDGPDSCPDFIFEGSDWNNIISQLLAFLS